MIALVQRVSQASVEVEGASVGTIGAGLLILLGVHRDDGEAEAEALAAKCARLRVFPDADGRMDTSLIDTGHQALVVPQFTLCGDTTQGNRPSFTEAAPPKRAERLYEHFVLVLSSELNAPVPTGVFGATMDVHLTNDGPVTFWVERSAETAS
jgi:D-tyrosyl-tRNA(Tyr) deacylase